LLDPRKSVSRFHAELREENGRWVFIDLNSQNGSWKDGQRVNRLVLEHGHEVLFGDYKLAFEDVKVAAPPPLPVPEADVVLTDFGGSAIVFRARFWVQEFEQDERARDQVRNAI